MWRRTMKRMMRFFEAWQVYHPMSLGSGAISAAGAHALVDSKQDARYNKVSKMPVAYSDSTS